MLKTLLKCPNKFVSVNHIRQKMGLESKISTFGLSSGSIEMDLFEKGYDITFYSNRYWIYEFWKCISNSPETVISAIKFFHENLSDAEVMYHKDKWYEHFKDPYERAAVYYLLNRYSEDGYLYGPTVTRDNFSPFNLMFLQKHAAAAKDLKLFYLKEENLVSKFNKISDDNIILLPMGKFKKDFIIKKNTHSITSPSYNNEDLKKYLVSNFHKMILLYKFDRHVDNFYEDNKTYINKLGFITENPELAEDLVVSNF